MSRSNTRADLHIHSRHSTRAADWVLRRLDFPASASDPLELYGMLRAAGMRFVTLTDQNTIDRSSIEKGAIQKSTIEPPEHD